MTMVFYHKPMSSSTRVHWALEELGASYEKVVVDLAGGEHQRAEYLAKNPNGKVPLLVVDGLPIYESLAILLYLGETFGIDKGLFPRPGLARAEVVRWMCWSSVTLSEAISRLLHNSSERFPDDEKNEKAAASAKREITELLGIAHAALERSPFLTGDAFNLADLSVAAYLPFLQRLGIETTGMTKLNEWLGQCIGRPALGRAMMG